MGRHALRLWLQRAGSAVLLAVTISGITPAAFGATHTFTTLERPFTPGVRNQGWWTNGVANPELWWATMSAINGDSNDNYLVGQVAGGWPEHRNFFTFDLSSLDLTGQTIISARLDLTVFRYGSELEEETYELFDVSTAPEILNYNEGISPTIFEDLGTGNSYGTTIIPRSLPDDIASVPLNTVGLADLSTAAGGFFSVGGKLHGVPSNLPGLAYRTVFGDSQGAGVQELVIETRPLDAAVAPEPSSLALLALGAPGLLARRRRKRAASV